MILNHLLHRGSGLFFLLLFSLGLVGCRLEVGKQDDATPTPTATPDTGTDTGTDSDTTTDTTDSSTVETTSNESASSSDSTKTTTVAAEETSFETVALAEAEYLEDITSIAAEKAMLSRSLVEEATLNQSEAKGLILQAAESLAVASDAYLRSEAAVFFVDPDSKAELLAQPDPLGSGVAGGSIEELENLTTSLEEIDQLLTAPTSEETISRAMEKVEDIGGKMSELEGGFRGFANAWKEQDQSNFRNTFFLESSGQAIARVFQGLLATAGDVLPARLSATGGGSGGVYSSLVGIREMFLGTDPEVTSALSLYALVGQKSSIQAALTRASIARAVALAGVLEVVPDDASTREQLLTSLEDLTNQLTSAAEAVGIAIVEDD